MNYPPKEREKRSLDQRTDLIPCNYGTHPVILGRMTFLSTVTTVTLCK